MLGALKNVCSIWRFSENIQVPMLHTHTVPPAFFRENKTYLHCLVRRHLVLTRRNSFRSTGSGLDRARVANVTRSVRGFFCFSGVCFLSLRLVVQIRGWAIFDNSQNARCFSTTLLWKCLSAWTAGEKAGCCRFAGKTLVEISIPQYASWTQPGGVCLQNAVISIQCEPSVQQRTAVSPAFEALRTAHCAETGGNAFSGRFLSADLDCASYVFVFSFH